ncbi:hypothetical protein J1605_002948 [Eschrichtius robustus]|uniref:Uncharacterized protein n=1 Tax=Eschrichtius robustus TaxID=9764 RepID=A0AB34HRH7_ESCRO|nr:hypothetical protein J1605_002948 [Eschrichtius robustus]
MLKDTLTHRIPGQSCSRPSAMVPVDESGLHATDQVMVSHPHGVNLSASPDVAFSPGSEFYFLSGGWTVFSGVLDLLKDPDEEEDAGPQDRAQQVERRSTQSGTQAQHPSDWSTLSCGS